MAYVLVLVLLAASAFSGYFQKGSSLLAACVMAWIAGTLEPNYSFDTAAYEMYYSFSPQTHVFEQGYMHLSYFFYTHGMEYSSFRLLTFFVAYIVFYAIVVRVTDRPAQFFLIYGLVIFLNDATQVRNFFMFVTVLLAYMVLKETTPARVLLAIGLLLLAVSFQTTALMYIVGMLLFVFIKNRQFGKRFVEIYFAFIALFSIAFIISGKSSVMSSLVSKLNVVSNRSNVGQAVTAYSAGGFSRYTITYVISFVIAFALIYLIARNYEQIFHDNVYYHAMYILILVGLVGVPFTIMSSGFERILRNSLIVFILILTNITTAENIKKYNLYFYLFGSLIVYGLFMYGTGYFTNDPLYMGYYIKYMLHFVNV